MRLRRLTLLLALTFACERGPPSIHGQPGEPLSGLTSTDSARFYAGQALFNKVFTPEEGLGPLFNENQCSACHTVPAAGGTTGFERIVKATRFDGPGRCDPLVGEGGENVRKQATPQMRAHGVVRESIPPSATEVGRFLPPFLFGLGLIEAISDETVLAGADPGDADGDGISGRAARGSDGRLTRFGRKAEFATIEEFTRGALLMEMGLTTRATDAETVNGQPVPAETDPVPEPDVDGRTVVLLTTFVRFLAPPARAEPRSRFHADTVAAGEQLFGELGCPNCHVPTMTTGPSDVPALSNKTVHLYSDLLLHDMGPELTDVCGYAAAPEEVRTEMLMGLHYRELFLHDGRAFDLREAILAHGGEAQAARDAFSALTWLQQEFLLAFLRSL